MMGRIRNFLSGSALWAGLGFVVIVLHRVFQMGVRKQQDKCLKETLKAYEERNRHDQKVRSYSSDTTRDELSKWVRK